ncbi:response regulator [Sphingomonas cannabina]|uniref:response regulator n=1 Tax=Sphingomonas cannabina TaxID=2899123 RepID=UPI001F41C1E0|nr:response regulator [Sphingomonas cannabina]UIJ46319.1 response regulator [Sphingomonas cannabina]
MTPENAPVRHLVLIEDDAAVRRALQLLLRGQGYEVYSFSEAAPALADAALSGASHVVIDYALPSTDGIAVLRALRASGWRGVAVLITAFYSHALQLQAKAAGFAAVLAKPFRDDALIDALAEPQTDA